MTDLHTTYLGLRLRSPIIASPSPLTGRLEYLRALDDAGAGAVVLPSLFEEQIEHETAGVERLLAERRPATGSEASTDGLSRYNHGAESYLALVRAAKASLDIPVIASLNGTDIGDWLRYTRLLEEAGADAIELNLYSIAADPSIGAAALEGEQCEVVSLLSDDMSIPLCVKISPYYSALAAFVTEVERAGADGVVLFNRFYQPDLDPETLAVNPVLRLSRSDEALLPVRWVAILRRHLSMSIAASGGVERGRDIARAILAGADAVMTTSALLREGVGHLTTLDRELRAFMAANDHHSIDAMRGLAQQGAVADPDAYERANYIGMLATGWHPPEGATP